MLSSTGVEESPGSRSDEPVGLGLASEVLAFGELAPLDTSSLRDRARRSIRASIVAGEIEAGEIYPVTHFATKLGVSATPIREALFDLAGAGIVQSVRNRGFRVPVLSDSDLDELLDLRMLLERPAVVRFAAKRGLADPRELRRLAADISVHAKRGDILAFLSSDRHFHGELLRRSENKRLAAIVMDLRDQTRLYGLARLAESGRLEESAREHTELLAAIEAGDGPAANHLITKHLHHTRGVWAGREELEVASDSVPGPGRG
ncbi:MAG: GntR family transcriptional regulator [Candidatus Dormibacteria bacterium]